MSRWLILVLMVWSAAIALSADTYPRQPAIDVLHYRFALALGEQSSRIEGEAQADGKHLLVGRFLLGGDGDRWQGNLRRRSVGKNL